MIFFDGDASPLFAGWCLTKTMNNNNIKINFEINPEQREKLKVLSRVTGVRLSEMYRQVFKRGMEEYDGVEKFEPLKLLK